MNTVKYLQENPFGRRPLEEKLQVKEMGRPMPSLSIKKTTTTKTRSYNRVFKMDINKGTAWLCGKGRSVL